MQFILNDTEVRNTQEQDKTTSRECQVLGYTKQTNTHNTSWSQSRYSAAQVTAAFSQEPTCADKFWHYCLSPCEPL